MCIYIYRGITRSPSYIAPTLEQEILPASLRVGKVKKVPSVRHRSRQSLGSVRSNPWPRSRYRTSGNAVFPVDPQAEGHFYFFGFAGNPGGGGTQSQFEVEQLDVEAKLIKDVLQNLG
jgi:hypothetical protein